MKRDKKKKRIIHDFLYSRNPCINEKKLDRLKNARQTQQENDLYRDLSSTKEELERYSNLFLPGLSSPPPFDSSLRTSFQQKSPPWNLEIRFVEEPAPRDFHSSILSCPDYRFPEAKLPARIEIRGRPGRWDKVV